MAYYPEDVRRQWIDRMHVLIGRDDPLLTDRQRLTRACNLLVANYNSPTKATLKRWWAEYGKQLEFLFEEDAHCVEEADEADGPEEEPFQ